MNIKQLSLIFFSIILNTLAQIMLKIGVNKIVCSNFDDKKVLENLYNMLLSPYVICSLLVYTFSMTVWLLVLSKVEVSFAYPLTSLGYILTAAIGYIFLQEEVNLIRVIGIIIIIIGVYFVSNS